MLKIVSLDNYGQNCQSGQIWSKLSIWTNLVKLSIWTNMFKIVNLGKSGQIVNLDKSGQIVNLDNHDQNCQSGQLWAKLSIWSNCQFGQIWSNCQSGQMCSKLSIWTIMVKIVNLDKSGQYCQS